MSLSSKTVEEILNRPLNTLDTIFTSAHRGHFDRENTKKIMAKAEKAVNDHQGRSPTDGYFKMPGMAAEMHGLNADEIITIQRMAMAKRIERWAARLKQLEKTATPTGRPIRQDKCAALAEQLEQQDHIHG